MTSIGGGAVSKGDLFDRLAEGHAARVTVVTPNRRLAQSLRAEFDASQAAKGLPVWDDADILPLGAFLERLYEDALHSEIGRRAPLLPAEAQELALWEAVVGASHAHLLGASAAASQCADAWRLAHAWRIDGAIGKFAGNDDHEAFAGWVREYLERTAGETDRARLPDLVSGWLPSGSLRMPRLLVAHAFDLLPTQTREFFDACARNGIEVCRCEPARHPFRPIRKSFTSPRDELEAAARWARARIEAGAGRIGVVVPELGERRKEVARVFARVLQPGRHLPGAHGEPLPFNLSLGAPLAEFALVQAALSILRLALGEVAFSEASRLLRSPFLGGADAERASRARLDARLRGTLPARLTLPRLIAQTRGCPRLRQVLETLLEARRAIAADRLSPREWARRFTALLDAAGFPGARAPDSEEFQARTKLLEMLRDLALLERVAGRMRADEALAKLARDCARTLFQPEAPPAPVQVLGLLESAGLDFDALWVSGMTEDAWPLAARHNPFLPVALQKKAGIPEASAEASLALDRRITEGWMGAAPEVVFSHALKDEERDLLPSPLVAAVPQGDVEVPEFSSYRDLIFRWRKTERFTDEAAPPLAVGKIRGGTRVLADQAACPFRAFARWRLGAEGLDAPSEGPDAMARGRLLHEFMKRLWDGLKASRALQSEVGPAVDKAAREAVKEAGLEGRFADLERARLARLAAEWLDVERERGEFEVVALEEKREIRISELALAGRIDRMDRLADGSHLLIDYKTGRASPNDWLGERPDEPQLPLYAVSARDDVGAVAFARVRPGDMKFMGLCRVKDQVPGLKPSPDWNSLLSEWKKSLESLAEGFAAGDARVDPKRGLATCRNCDLQPLCRVHERLSALGGEEE